MRIIDSFIVQRCGNYRRAAPATKRGRRLLLIVEIGEARVIPP
jgi:hypothetical protein